MRAWVPLPTGIGVTNARRASRAAHKTGQTEVGARAYAWGREPGGNSCVSEVRPLGSRPGACHGISGCESAVAALTARP